MQASAYDLDCAYEYFEQTPSLSAPSSSQTLATHPIKQLCKTGFVLGYDISAKRPVWSVVYLSADRIQAASRLERRDLFHSEEQLPSDSRRDLHDFMSDNLDRGHLSPSADMPTLDSQYDSFSLANIVHQQPEHNRGVWREVEYLARLQASELGGAYVVTGAIYGSHLGVEPPKLNHGLSAPSFLYKAIYFDRLKLGGVYLSPNDKTSRVAVISLAQLKQRFGVDAFPSLPKSDKQAVYPLLYPEADEWHSYQFLDEDYAEPIRLSMQAVYQWLLALIKWFTGWIAT